MCVCVCVCVWTYSLHNMWLNSIRKTKLDMFIEIHWSTVVIEMLNLNLREYFK